MIVEDKLIKNKGRDRKYEGPMWLKLRSRCYSTLTFIMLELIINDLPGQESNEVAKYENDRK